MATKYWVSRNGVQQWVDAPDLDDLTATIGVQPAYRVEDAYRDIYVPEGKAVISIVIDDGQALDLTFTDIMRARSLIGGHAINSGTIGTGSALTWTQVRAQRDVGFEILNHSRTHGSDPGSLQGFTQEVVYANREIAGQNIRSEGFVAPGTWTGDFYWNTPSKLDGTPQLEILRSLFAAATSYITDGNTANRNFKIRNPVRKHGITRGVPLDGLTLANFKLDYNQAVGVGGIVNCSAHAGSLDTTNFTAIMDFLVTERAAGRCEILTQTAALYAKVGPRVNLLPDGDFHLDATGAFMGWLPTGSPTVTAGDGPGATNSVTIPDASNTLTTYIPARDLRTVEVQFDAKNASPGVNANARFFVRGQDIDTATNVQDTSMVSGHTSAPGWVNLTDSWQTFRAYLNVDPRVEYMALWAHFSSNAGRAGGWKLANVKVYRS